MAEFFSGITHWMAKSCDNNPFLVLGLIFVFFIQVNTLEAIIEKLIFGQRFNHWGDIAIASIFIYWSVYAVCICGRIKDGVQ